MEKPMPETAAFQPCRRLEGGIRKRCHKSIGQIYELYDNIIELRLLQNFSLARGPIVRDNFLPFEAISKKE